jgi:micrococcal nuclease
MNKIFIKFILILLICNFTIISFSAEIIGTVINVLDGDTLIIKEQLTNNEIKPGKFKIRLADIDAPELKQEFGTDAKHTLETFVNSKIIKVVYHQIDMFGRIVGTIYLNNESINEKMVKHGYAWWYQQYSKKLKFAQLQSEAKLAKRGMWVTENNMPPWEFRKIKTVNNDKN